MNIKDKYPNAVKIEYTGPKIEPKDFAYYQVRQRIGDAIAEYIYNMVLGDQEKAKKFSIGRRKLEKILCGDHHFSMKSLSNFIYDIGLEIDISFKEREDLNR